METVSICQSMTVSRLLLLYYRASYYYYNYNVTNQKNNFKIERTLGIGNFTSAARLSTVNFQNEIQKFKLGLLYVEHACNSLSLEKDLKKSRLEGETDKKAVTKNSKN